MKRLVFGFPGFLRGIVAAGSVGVLLLAALGDFTPLGRYSEASPRGWEAYDRELIERTRSLADLRQEAESIVQADLRAVPPAVAMDALHETVSARFAHGAAEHTPVTNWVAWTLGQGHPAFRTIQDPQQMTSRGSTLLCSQISYILVALANEIGIPARHVGLNGHVVMEAWYDGAWHLYDPDMEVVLRDESGAVLGIGDLLERPDLLRSTYAARGEPEFAEFFLSDNDNTYAPGAWFTWKAQLLAAAEPVNGALKYVLPLLLLLWASYRRPPVRLHQRRSRLSPDSTS